LMVKAAYLSSTKSREIKQGSHRQLLVGE